MPDETNIQRILEYVEQHRNQYALPVLREQLLAAGYAPDDIEAAFARLLRQAVAPSTVQAAPSAPPNRDAEIKRMVEYLRQNIGRYNLTALREQLLATQHDSTLVEAAIARVQAEQPVNRGTALPLGLVVALFNLVFLPVLLWSIVSVVSQTQLGDFVENVLFAIWPITMIGELVAGIVLLRGSRNRLARILLFGVLFSIAIPIILGVILLGVCLIILTGSGSFR